jgi:hypothetical protein
MIYSGTGTLPCPIGGKDTAPLSGSAAGHSVTADARVATSCGIVSGGLPWGINSDGRVAGTEAPGSFAVGVYTGAAEYGAPILGEVSLAWGVMMQEKKKKADTTEIHAKE